MKTDKTAAARRVLTAINKNQAPEHKDVILLKAYCPDIRDLDPDEIACIVIQESLKRKKAARTVAAKTGTI